MGRQGVRFYYPSRGVIAVLEEIGIKADNHQVDYEGAPIPLMEAYRRYVKGFMEAVKKGDATLFSPFILGDSHAKRLN